MNKIVFLIHYYYRGDEYDEAVQSMMSLGAAMLRVGGSNLLDYFSSPSSTSSSGPVAVNKLGVAADTWDTALSQEEILHRKQVGVAVDYKAFDTELLRALFQVAKIVSTLSPEQIQAQQGVVFSHIQQQQIQDNLTDTEATKLLIETLQHNGLPVPASLQPSSGTENTDENATANIDLVSKFGSLVSGATGVVSSLLNPSSPQAADPTSPATNLQRKAPGSTR